MSEGGTCSARHLNGDGKAEIVVATNGENDVTVIAGR